jgi:hypothetical protein
MKKNTFANSKKNNYLKKIMENLDVNEIDNRLQEIEKKLTTEMQKLSYYVAISEDSNYIRYINFDKDKEEGIYVFLYEKKDENIEELKRSLFIKGPKNSENNKTENDNVIWDYDKEKKFICLYVGKTTNFKERLKDHLLLGTDQLPNKGDKKNQLNKKTTACQLRSGFDYLYSKEKVNIKEKLINHLFVSFYPVKDDFIKRFYLENYFIWRFKPWFNLDSER